MRFRTMLWPLAAAGIVGCSTLPDADPSPNPFPLAVSSERSRTPAGHPGLITAGYHSEQTPSAHPGPSLAPNGSALSSLGLDELSSLGLEKNPRLAQTAIAIDTARGRAVQAGLYPNPTVGITGDELGDRQGPMGILSLPQVSQELVTAGKLGLGQAAATKEVDQATLALRSQRYTLLSNIRSAYYDAVTIQRRIDILAELVALAEQSVGQAEARLKANLGTQLDRGQLTLELERLRTEEQAARRELPVAYRRLAAVVGVSNLLITAVDGNLELPLPPYELERLQPLVLAVHPDPQSARVAVDRARLLVRRAEVEPIPNVTLTSGYVLQNQNRSNDWMLGVSVPVPVWNRNQGNILAARGQLGEAVQEVSRVENDLVDRLATAYREFTAARQRAEQYRTSIVPQSKVIYEQSAEAYQRGGQFDYLRVLQAQRSMIEARLEYNRALGDAWRAASVISGLTLEDHWPPVPAGGVIP